MGNRCVECGKPIRTGRKYCSEHRGTISGAYPEAKKVRRQHKRIVSDMLFLWVLLVAIGMWFLITGTLITKIIGIVLILFGSCMGIWGLFERDKTEEIVFKSGLQRKEQREK